MGFRGWPAEALEFFEGLEADNSRTYWTGHRALYERSVKAPMAELLAELAGEFGEGRIFRPNRDVRFSLDKSPYKTNIAATVGDDGYVSLSADGLGAGRGMYVMGPDQLDRYRRAVDADSSGEALEAVVATLAGKGISVTGHDTLKTAPRGYPRDHRRVELLRSKGLIAWRDWPVEPWLGTARPGKLVGEFLRTSAPLHDWLRDHVGPSSEEPGRRR